MEASPGCGPAADPVSLLYRPDHGALTALRALMAPFMGKESS